MKTKNSSPARNVVLAALFLALAFVLLLVVNAVQAWHQRYAMGEG